jgi:hypothetical protein
LRTGEGGAGDGRCLQDVCASKVHR